MAPAPAPATDPAPATAAPAPGAMDAGKDAMKKDDAAKK